MAAMAREAEGRRLTYRDSNRRLTLDVVLSRRKIFLHLAPSLSLLDPNHARYSGVSIA